MKEWDKIHGGTGPSFIHLLHSRFMQEQGSLTALAWARLLLFQVFCLPTITRQSSQNFLWIIKTDPHLHKEVLKYMISLLEPYHNIYLIGSNVNFLVNQQVTGLWRESEIQELQSGTGKHIYTGHRQRLALAMALANQFTILESRLDADDGLHKDYMKYIQQQAMEVFQDDQSQQQQQQQKPKLRYKYWCSRRILEWHWQLQSSHRPEHKLQRQSGVVPNDAHAQEEEDQEHHIFHDHDGTVQFMVNSKMCITPGITVGYPAGVSEFDIPVVQHDKLMQTIHANKTDRPCGADDPLDCISVVEEFTFDAIRSRTPTSAGMAEVLLLSKNTNNQNDNMDKKQDTIPQRRHHHHHQDSAAAAVDIAGRRSSSTTTTTKHDSLAQMDESTPWMQYSYWHFLYNSFGIVRDQVMYVQNYLQGEHLYAIAHDNLSGQCTTFHSCKVGYSNLLSVIKKQNNSS